MHENVSEEEKNRGFKEGLCNRVEDEKEIEAIERRIRREKMKQA